MRINIKTKGRVTDGDVKCLYLLREEMKYATPKMVRGNLDFIANKYGLTVLPKRTP